MRFILCLNVTSLLVMNLWAKVIVEKEGVKGVNLRELKLGEGFPKGEEILKGRKALLIEDGTKRVID